jgi:hypothetical protein
VREANANSFRRDPCHNVRHGHDKDGDSGGLFALYTRRFYTDWRISSDNGTEIAAASGKVSFTLGPKEKTLKAIA